MTKTLTQKVWTGTPAEKLAKTPTYTEKVVIPSAPVQKELSIIPPYSHINETKLLEKDSDSFNTWENIIATFSGADLTRVHTPLPTDLSVDVYSFTTTKAYRLKFVSGHFRYSAFAFATLRNARIELRVFPVSAGIPMLIIPLVITERIDTAYTNASLFELPIGIGSVIEVNLDSYCPAAGGSSVTMQFKFNLYGEEIKEKN